MRTLLFQSALVFTRPPPVGARGKYQVSVLHRQCASASDTHRPTSIALSSVSDYMFAPALFFCPFAAAQKTGKGELPSIADKQQAPLTIKNFTMIIDIRYVKLLNSMNTGKSTYATYNDLLSFLALKVELRKACKVDHWHPGCVATTLWCHMCPSVPLLCPGCGGVEAELRGR